MADINTVIAAITAAQDEALDVAGLPHLDAQIASLQTKVDALTTQVVGLQAKIDAAKAALA